MSSKQKLNSIKALMQDKIKAVTKQIDSPYAKYNSRGELMCIVCATVLKSNIIWQAHINKKQHLENVEKMKLRQNMISSFQSSSQPPKKQVKVDVQHNESISTCDDVAERQTVTDLPKKSILKKHSAYSSDESDEEKPLKKHVKLEGTIQNGVSFEVVENSAVSEIKQEPENDLEKEASTKNEVVKSATSLPEGFFDDPVADAKARKVEYHNKEDEEWLAFLREVSEADVESRQIIEEDKEEAAMASQLEQTDEQIKHLERIVELDKKKKTQLQEMHMEDSMSNEDSSNSSNEEFNSVIWRTKNSLI